MIVESAVTGDRLSRIRELAVDLLGNLGYELNDLEFSSGEGGAVLRLYIDCAAGVSLDDCAHVSRMFGALLDVEDLIPGRYILEISSPGLNRRLSRIQDFQGCYGETIKISLARPLNGRRRFKGILRACRENPLTVTIEVDGQTFVVPLDETAKCNLVYNFDKIF